MRKVKEVLRLRFELGLGQRQIARSCGIGLSTVHDRPCHTRRRGEDRRQNLEGCVRAGSAIPIPAATNIPHSFAWARPSREAMDQANEIKLIRHGRELAADCAQRKRRIRDQTQTRECSESIPRLQSFFSER
jgi:hypothetical protein